MINVTTEAFINMCDELLIPAEESLFKKTKITIDKAKDAKTQSEMISRMYGEEPLIHLTGNDSYLLKNIFNKMKKKGIMGSIAAGVNNANGCGYASYKQQKDIEKSGQEDAMKYKLIENDGEYYLIFHKYQLA